MPMETCAYCDQFGPCDLWHQACPDCWQRFIQLALLADEPFVGPPGSIRSYPKRWLEERSMEDNRRLIEQQEGMR